MLHTFNTVKPIVDGYINLKKHHWYGNGTDAIRDEPAFFNATPSFIRTYGNEAIITNHILNHIFRQRFDNAEFHCLQVNSYVHRLAQPGMYGNIPGWHCDYAKRESEGDGMFTLEEDESVKHWLVVFGDNAPLPQFINKKNITIDDKILKNNTWPEVSKVIDKKVNNGWRTYEFKQNELILIRGNELYRSMPSTKTCYRLYIRITQYSEDHPYRQCGTKGRKRTMNLIYTDYNGNW